MPKVKTKVDACIDWLEVTSKAICKSEADLKRKAGSATKTDPGDWHTDKAFNRYKVCVRGPGGALALCGRDDMGTHIILGGVALTTFRALGAKSHHLLANFTQWGYRATRIDLAIDAIDSRIDGLQTWRDFDEKRAETRAAAPFLVSSGNSGWTLYIGARQSDKHMRIYNKYAEVQNKGVVPEGVDDWVRFEIVLKRHHSRAAAALIQERGVAITARSLINDYARNPADPKWNKVMEGEITEIGKSVRKMTNTRRWLMEVAAKTLAREFQADPSIWQDFNTKVGLWFDWYEKRK
jgi:DNA relaxase NicK